MSNRQEDNNDPFGGDNDSSPFGASGNDNPFGASNDNPFGATNNNDNPFGIAAPAAPADPFAIGNDAGHVVPNPFGAAPPADANPFGTVAAAPADPFAIGNDAAQPAHVVPNPFGAFGAAAPPPAAQAQDPFAIGNDAPHVVANPFGAAAPNADPFGPAPPQAQGPFGAVVGGLLDNLLGGNNPFGIANAAPADDDPLDMSQHSLGETFLAGHMTRLSQQTCMFLSEEERRWTLELKAAVEASEDLPKMSDMDLAQSAITARGNVLNALLSIKALQEFRKTYDIDDTPEQGLECVRALLDQQEGTFLEIETNPQTQESTLVVDLREFQPSKALQLVPGKPAEHSWQVLARGYYYLNRATQPSLSSIRKGLFLVVDCDGVGWDNFSSEVDERMHAELIQHLPVKWKKTMAYGTGMVANICWGLSKRLWSNEFQQVLELGCRLVDTDPSRPPRRLAEMYRQPDLATVTNRFERRAAELLDRREANERDFILPPQAAS